MPQNIKCADCKDTSKAKTKTKFYAQQPICKEISIKVYLSLHNAKKGKCANLEETRRKNLLLKLQITTIHVCISRYSTARKYWCIFRDTAAVESQFVSPV